MPLIRQVRNGARANLLKAGLYRDRLGGKGMGAAETKEGG